MIALFAAMDTEVHPLLSPGSVRTTTELKGFQVTYVDYGGVVAVVCQTGIGRSAEAATAAVLDSGRFTAAISFGTAGGISPSLRAGSILLCDPVCVSADCGYCDQDGSLAANGGLLRATLGALERSGLAVQCGTSLTVDRAVLTVAEKRRLREAYGPNIVEMESYWVGNASARRDVPFLTVRIVTDEVEDSVPDVAFVGPNGKVDYDTLSAWARQNPGEVTLLSKLYERWRIGAAAMEQFAEAFLRPSVLSSLIVVR
jgi:nucleoside phosphorylase